MPKLPRHTLCLIGGLALLGLAPRPAQAQAASFCQGRMAANSFYFTSRAINAASTELRYNMVLQNNARGTLGYMVRFLHPSSTGGQINTLMSLAPGQQQVILLGIETMHPDVAGDMMRDNGPNWILQTTRVECSG